MRIRGSRSSPVVARFIFGTTAEWIKIEPVVERMRRLQISVEVYCANQQGEEIREFLAKEEFQNVPGTEERPSLVSPWQVPRWFLGALTSLVRLPRVTSSRVVWFVHGDTMTALLGAIAASLRREHLAHIEAGLRSSSFRSPFPEELIRRLIGRCANTHFAPSEPAAKNLRYWVRRRNFEVIVTHGNTVLDALHTTTERVEHGRPPSVVALLHRSEFLARAELVRSTMSALASYSAEEGCVINVVVDALASERFRALGLISPGQPDGILNAEGAAEGLRFYPKMPHQDFLKMLLDAEVVVTDSGGVQEETAAFGIPCFIFRDRTERSDGLGKTALLVGLDPARLTAALREPREVGEHVLPPESPSNVIVQWMQEQL